MKYDHAFYNKPILSHCLHGNTQLKRVFQWYNMEARTKTMFYKTENI